MGCCISKPPPRRRSPPRPPAPAFRKTHDSIAPQNATTGNLASPSPMPLEEETVKEVLSETPLPKPQLPETPQPLPKLQEDGPETKILISKLEEAAEVVSEYSEMYSVSESISTATTATTATDKRETEVTSRESREVRQRLKSRSPAKAPRKRPLYAGDLARGGERRVANRSPSPAKRNLTGVSGTGPERVREPGRARTAAAQRNAGPTSGPLRRDPGETSRRRSSSPATRKAGEANAGVGGRSSSAKRAGSAGDRSAKGEDKKDSGTESAAETKTSEEHSYKDTVPEQGNESLDNPLVSLECFIFL